MSLEVRLSSTWPAALMRSLYPRPLAGPRSVMTPSSAIKACCSPALVRLLPTTCPTVVEGQGKTGFTPQGPEVDCNRPDPRPGGLCRQSSCRHGHRRTQQRAGQHQPSCHKRPQPLCTRAVFIPFCPFACPRYAWGFLRKACKLALRYRVIIAPLWTAAKRPPCALFAHSHASKTAR